MNSTYLLIGGNLGNRIENLAMARSLIENELGKIIKVSSIYETAAWGITKQPDFLNQVLLIKTKFSLF
jgi:2-amino-4-hydroxy-6-hydroxymethyldihydropteridine diphosphokinase